MQINKLYENMLTEGIYEHDIDFEDLNLESIVLGYIKRKIEDSIQPPEEPKELRMSATELSDMSDEEYERIESEFDEAVREYKREIEVIDQECWREVKYDVKAFKINIETEIEQVIAKHKGA